MSELIQRAVQRPYDIPLNVAIWISFKPIIKVYLSIGAGFLLSKTKVLTPELSKGISQLVLLIFMPCLLFNNIVSQIKDTDIKLLGVIVFTGFIYYVVGLGWGFVVYLISPIPRAWFGGLLLCCMLNNCSDLPIAYVQTIGKTPFLPADAAKQGQSYAVLIVIIFIFFTFNLGGTRLVEWDATRDDPRGEEPTVPPVSWQSAKRFFRRITGKETVADKEYAKKENEEKEKLKEEKEERKHDTHNKDSSDDNSSNDDLEAQTSGTTSSEPYLAYNETDHMSFLASQATGVTTESTLPPANRSVVSAPAAASVHRAHYERPYGSTEVYYSIRRGSETEFVDAQSTLNVNYDAPAGFQNLVRHMSRSTDGKSPDRQAPPKLNRFQRAWAHFKRHWFHFKGKNKVTTYICNFCEDIFLPQMMSLILGLIVAMIPWVRRVFVKGQNIHHFHDAPDQNPPLDFLMEFLQFFADAQVPLGLMLLGGTLASLKVGKMVKGFWKTLVLIVVFKLALLPIIACAWIHRIRAIGWISMDDAMTPIVLAVASGTPSATVQIYLTLAWIDPTKESLVLNCLAVSLMAQYIFLPITLTILMTYIVMHYV